MPLRGLLLILLAIAGMTATSGCVVAESVFLTTHMRHDTQQTYDSSDLRAKEPVRRPAIDVPAEAASE